MPKSINLTGTVGKTYDLDKTLEDTRTSEGELKVQIWYWNPNLKNSHSKPNPPEVSLGQIWLSKLITVDDPKFEELSKIVEEK